MRNERKFADLEKLLMSSLQIKMAKVHKNVEVPEYSKHVIRQAVRYACRDVAELKRIDKTVEEKSAMKGTLWTYLKLLSEKKLPIIVVVPHQIKFKNQRTNKLSVLIVQLGKSFEKFFVTKTTDDGNFLVVRPNSVIEAKEHLSNLLGRIETAGLDFLCLPELCFVNDTELKEFFTKFAQENDLFVIGGSFHDVKTKSNISPIYCPTGESIFQKKIFRSEEMGEGILAESPIQAIHIIDFDERKFCVLICIDAEREAIRQVLKERLLKCRCPELIFNPSCTTAIKRAHANLANLMSLIFTVIIFCNAKGRSALFFPLKELKDRGFKVCELSYSDQQEMHKETIDLDPLIQYKRHKVKCLLAMIE